jgi:hypothetical protein
MTPPCFPRRWLIALALTAGITGCASAPLDKPIKLDKVDKGPGTLTEARQYLQGRWTLMSMDVFPPNQAPLHGVASGNMVYDDYANMTVYMQFTEEAAKLAQQIGIPLQNGVLSTTGKTVIDINSHAISYVLEGQDALRPPTNPLDTNRPRYWEANGNTLTLRTKDDAGSVLSVSVWRKETGKN